nr:fibronectin type III domain-containing protein [Acidobacteriota bacterium]
MYTTNRLSLLSLIPGKLRQRWVRLALILSVGLVGLTASVSLYASMSEARQSNSGTAVEAVETLTARMVAAPATITVNNAGEAVGNNGNCTLREAIIAANTNTASGAMAGECVAGMAGADTIVFSLGAGTPAINLTSQLPIITEPVTIKGNSGGATRVELNGAGAGAGANGLRITAGNSTILRLAINRFTGDGILISGAGLNTIKGCLIGTNASGTAAQANANGIRILGSSNHTIGGTATGDRNLISGNTGAGILIAYDTPNTLAASGNKVIGNFIGTDANGKIDLGNGGFGVDIVGGSNSAIGGVTPEERNIISGNNGGGVGISGTTATGNVIIGNFIGLDITSLAPLGNGGAGVSINGAPNNRVGGVGVPCPADNTTTCSEGNTIRFNGSKGVVVKMNSATNNRILGNSISDNTGLGIDLGDNGLTNHTVPGAPTGVSATAGNAQATVSFTPPDSDGGSVIYAYTVTSNPGGITASGSSSPITVTGLMNGTPYTFTVKATNFVGASLASGASNSVTPMAPPPFAPSNPSNTLNSVAPNAVLMLPDSTGPNSLQNFPVLTGVTVGASSSTINGTLRSSANTTFRIEFFLNPLCDSSGNGEGQTFLGSTDVTTSIFIFNDINSGTVSFSKTLDFPLPGGLFVTATATRISGGIPVETSEFSACRSIPFTTGGCHYIVNPGVMNFSAAGGSTVFNVTAEGGCGWSATSNVGWVHVTSGASGSGNGTVGISVDANTGTFRFGTVTIAGTDYTFSQDAPCSATVSPSAMAFTAPAGSSTFNLYIPANCPWTISDPTAIFPWITVTTQLSGSGPTIVDFTIEANPGPSERVGVIMVAGQTYILTQDAPCTASINPSSKNFTSVGGNGTFNLTIGATCSWMATTADSWITITSATTGMGNAAFSYTVAANTGGQRTGIISVAGKALVISQEPACPPMISPSSQSFMPAGGNGNINVTIGAGCTWQATTNNTWITINSGANGTGNGTVNFTVAANTGAERSGVITVAGQSFLVQQSSPCTYTVSPSLQGIVAAGGTGSTNVTVGATCSWMAASSVPWITVTSGATGTGNGTVNYSVATNGTGSQRSGQITIADKSLLITQDAGCTFTVMPTSQNFVAAGGMNTVSVTTAGGCAWLATSNAPWITITSSLQSPKDGQLLGKSPISQFPGFKNSTAGVGNGTVAYTVAANTGPPRTGTMFVAGELVTINQATG